MRGNNAAPNLLGLLGAFSTMLREEANECAKPMPPLEVTPHTKSKSNRRSVADCSDAKPSGATVPHF